MTNKLSGYFQNPYFWSFFRSVVYRNKIWDQFPCNGEFFRLIANGLNALLSQTTESYLGPNSVWKVSEWSVPRLSHEKGLHVRLEVAVFLSVRCERVRDRRGRSSSHVQKSRSACGSRETTLPQAISAPTIYQRLNFCLGLNAVFRRGVFKLCQTYGERI